MEDLYHSGLKHNTYDAIIIGSGLGGLTTAALFAKSKKKVLVLEKHYEPGGFTHTFKRKHFVWDVGVHYVGQMNKENAMMRKVFDYVTDGRLKWSSMGDIYDKAIIAGDEYSFVCGVENQINEFIRHFPEEEVAIRKYYKIVGSMGTATAMFFGERSMPDFISKLFGGLLRRKFNKFSDQTTYEVLSGLTKNEKLIAALCAQCGNYGLPPQQSSFAMQAMIAEHYLDGGNYPIGGSAEIHKTILRSLKNNGGELALKAEVAHVIIKKGKATGVKLTNGDELLAPVIVSDAGASNTFKKLISSAEKLPAAFIEKLQKTKASVAHICLYLGLDRSDEDLKLPKYNYWLYNNYSFDKEFKEFIQHPEAEPPLAYISFPSAKDPQWAADNPGKATIQVVCAASYDWVKQWEDTQWKKRGDEYNAFKKRLEERLLEKLYSVVPQIKGHVVWSEISTPLSTKHFSNHPQGEIYGLEHTPARFRIRELRVHTPIKNLYLTGQDLVTVGVGGALFSGVLTASSILKKNYLWNALRYKVPQ
ncbi:MAG TPA: NAD(P)/FAD-dependent oxidoreductase [Cytophagaceae bacterium]|jgi:all-trans-retinol 13,14-reductase|nr:NAD(P)/FAD-dependent oxidoreductase [Cytophagaceae bacterium]